MNSSYVHDSNHYQKSLGNGNTNINQPSEICARLTFFSNFADFLRWKTDKSIRMMDDYYAYNYDDLNMSNYSLYGSASIMERQTVRVAFIVAYCFVFVCCFFGKCFVLRSSLKVLKKPCIFVWYTWDNFYTCIYLYHILYTCNIFMI